MHGLTSIEQLADGVSSLKTGLSGLLVTPVMYRPPLPLVGEARGGHP